MVVLGYIIIHNNIIHSNGNNKYYIFTEVDKQSNHTRSITKSEATISRFHTFYISEIFTFEKATPFRCPSSIFDMSQACMSNEVLKFGPVPPSSTNFWSFPRTATCAEIIRSYKGSMPHVVVEILLSAFTRTH